MSSSSYSANTTSGGKSYGDDVQLRNGAVVVFLEAQKVIPTVKCVDESGQQPEDAVPSGAETLLRSGSNTVYLTGALIYKTADSEIRAQIPLSGFAQLVLQPPIIEGNAADPSTTSEGTLPFALTGHGTINLKQISPQQVSDGTIPLPISSKLADGTLPFPSPTKEAFKNRRFLVALLSQPQKGEAGEDDGSSALPIAGNAWIDVIESGKEDGTDVTEGTLPFEIYGTGIVALDAANSGLDAPTMLFRSSVTGPDVPIDALQTDAQADAVDNPPEGARVVTSREASLSITAFRYLNDPGTPTDWKGTIGSVSLSGSVNQGLLGTPGSFQYPLSGGAIVYGNIRTPNTPGNAPGGTGLEIFSHPVKLIGNGRMNWARGRPGETFTMQLTASPFINMRFTQGTVELRWERAVIPGDGDIPYVPFQVFATGNIVTMAAGTFDPIIDFGKVTIPPLPWTLPPRRWPPIWPPPPPPPPFDPPRPWPSPRPGPGPDPAPEWLTGEPVQPDGVDTGPLIGGPVIPGWIDPVPLEPEIIGPSLGPVEVGGDPLARETWGTGGSFLFGDK